eukprot:2736603-Pyramimonas_sp.AAC.1
MEVDPVHKVLYCDCDCDCDCDCTAAQEPPQPVGHGGGPGAQGTVLGWRWTQCTRYCTVTVTVTVTVTATVTVPVPAQYVDYTDTEDLRELCQPGSDEDSEEDYDPEADNIRSLLGVYSLSPSAMGARYGYIHSSLLRLVPAT